MNSFAIVDNKLAASQLSIGLSSNLAQIALSYTYTFPDRKYYDAVCILASLAQVSIDSAKKSYDMDLMEEINRLKVLIDVDKNLYPAFWLGVRKGFDKKKINLDIMCPMNYLYNLKLKRANYNRNGMKLEEFFNEFELSTSRKMNTSKRMEKLISKYSMDLYNDVRSRIDDIDNMYEETLVLRDDFDNLIEDLRKTGISKNYLGFMSYLLKRGFGVTTNTRNNQAKMKGKLYKNRSILLKVLYELNPDALLKCFSKNKENKEKM